MLGLPKSTELCKQLPKKAIYTKFQMNTSAREHMDADVSRITIVNEISPARINIAIGEKISSLYVLLVSMKRKDFDERNIIRISKLIPQNMLLVLEFGQEAKLAVYHSRLMQTEWCDKNGLKINLTGLDLDKIWENIIIQVGGIHIEQGNTLDEQIAFDDEQAKIQNEISKLEKQARSETQPKKKFELVKRMKELKEDTF